MTPPLKATCHCGAVELRVTLSEGLSTARRCDCSFCRRRGAAAVSAPLNGVEVLRGADNLTLYQWGTGTANTISARLAEFTRIIGADRTQMSMASILGRSRA